MAFLGIKEIYCQINGKVYVSRDGGGCPECDVEKLANKCPQDDSMNYICTHYQLHWKELKADE